MKYLGLCAIALLLVLAVEDVFAAATIEVSWDAVAGADSYTVHYQTPTGADMVQVSTISALIALPDFIQGQVSAYVHALSDSGAVSGPSNVAYASYYPDVNVEVPLGTPNVTIKLIFE